MFLLDFLMLFLSLIFSVAFITLLERKLLGYVQHRKGPSKPSFKGLATPAADALKLLFKESASPSSSSWGLHLISPLLSLFLFLLIVSVLPFKEMGGWGVLSLVFMVSVLSWNVYPLFFSGWGSNSSYAFIGSARGIAQSISYEISLAFLAISLVCASSSLNFSFMSKEEYSVFLGLALMPSVVLWLYTGVAETNRAPFDFAESESELVSGFNIEYGSMKFALIFLAEYGMILFLSILTCVFMAFSNAYSFWSFTSVVLPVILWIWIRGTFPRYRYDLLMEVSWKCILPLSLGLSAYTLALYHSWSL